MIVVNFSDGIGNQLFQFAIGIALAKDRKQHVLFKNLEQFKLGQIDYSFRFVEQRFTRQLRYKIKSPQLIQDPIWSKIEIPKGSVELRGYWAYPTYFDQYESLFSGLKLKYCSKDFKQLSNSINFSKELAVHIRRGDYLNPEYIDFFGIQPEDYYKSAIKKVKQSKSINRIFVFSDDIPWCKEFFAQDTNIVYVSHSFALTDVEELFFMAQFNNIIISNSTFSWWAAYLGSREKNKTVITPKIWYKNKTAQHAYEKKALLFQSNFQKI